MESSPTTLAPLLLRNIITSLFIFADKSLINLARRYKLLGTFRHVLASCFLFLLRALPSLFPPIKSNHEKYGPSISKPNKYDNYEAPCAGGDSGIARALSQLLSLVNDIPVSSRKYEVVRSLAERIIDENHKEGVEALREVNRTVLSAAFSRTLGQLEASVSEQARENGEDGVWEDGPLQSRLGWVWKAVSSVKEFGRRREVSGSGYSVEKLAAELLWLALKLAACGCGEEAVWRWASVSNLGRLALSAEPRLQGSLVKVSALLFKQAKEMGQDEMEESKKEQIRQTKLRMLLSWLPLLCRASNGTDVPVLSVAERAELERVLEETIEVLEEENEQEHVLSLWLHHFTHCSSSDWPNLHASYARWCNQSRKQLLLQ